MKKERTHFNVYLKEISAFKIALIYLLIGTAWIAFSDQLILLISNDISLISSIQTIKGWFFVVTTSIILFYLIRRSSQNLIDEHKLMSQIIETVPVGIVFVNKDGQIAFANKNAESVLGLSKDKITSRTYNAPEWKITSIDGSLFPAEELPFSKVKKTLEQVRNIEHAIEYPDGKRVLLSVNASPLLNKKENFDGMIATIEDITEDNRLREQLREKDLLLNETGKIAKVGGWEFDPVTFKGTWTDEVARIHDLDPDLPTNVELGISFYNDKSKEKIQNAIKDAVELRHSYDLELEMKSAKGIEKWVRTIGHPVIEDNKVIKVRGSFQDITEHKKAELKLKQTKEFAENIIQTANVIFVQLDLAGNVLRINQPAEQITGYGQEEIFGKNWFEVLVPRNRYPYVWEEFEKIMQSGRVPEIFENPILTKSGGERHIIWKNNVVHEGDTIIGTISFGMNITERKQAEEKLKASETKYRSFFENSMDAILLTELTGNIISVNQAACDMFNRTEEEIIQAGRDQLVDLSDPNLPNLLAEREQKGKVRGEITMLRREGTKFPVEVSSALFLDDEGHYRTTMIIRDVTERKQAEESLRESEEKFSNAFHASPAGITLNKISDGKFIEVNDSFLKMFEFEREEVINRTSLELNMLTEDERKKLIKQQIETGGLQNFELTFQTKSGKPIHTLFSSKPMELMGEKCHVTTMIDITDKKKAEEQIRKNSEQLRMLSAHLQNVREEERTNLAREMHDEVGQLLTSIKMNLSLMKRGIKLKDKKLRIKELLDDVQTMSNLVDHAVSTVRKMITELRPELLDKLGLLSALEWYVEDFEKRTKIKSKFRSEFDTLKLEQNVELTIFRIVQEALTNVVKHAKASKTTIDVKKIKDGILVEIIDNGKGMSQEQLKGSSSFGLLGMRERAGIVGGKLEISSVIGKGTTVRLVISNK